MLNVVLKIIKTRGYAAVLVGGIKVRKGLRLLEARDSAVAGGGGASGRPEARPSGPICYAFLPSRATKYNSDFPSLPLVRYESSKLIVG